MAQGYRAPVNYRSAPSRVGTPEAIAISSGVAMLSEAPADPTNPATPIVVTVNGTSRTRVAGTPAAGQYRIRSQTLIGVNGQARTEYLPVLDFHSSDEGRSGTVDYYQTGTVLTAEWADALLALLSPLTGIAAAGDLQLTYPATTNVYAPGRPGRIAFLSDGSMYFSDGTQWRVVAANVSPNNWSEALATSLRFGIGSTSAFSAAWTTTESLGQAFGISSSQTYVASGSTGAASIGQALGLAFASAFTASWPKAQSMGTGLGFSAANSYTAGGSLTTRSDDFNRANGDPGTNWTAPTGLTKPAISSNAVTNASGVKSMFWSADTFNAKQFSGLTATPAVNLAGPTVRQQPGSDSCYVASMVYDSGIDDGTYIVALDKVVNGSPTRLGMEVPGQAHLPLSIDADGSTIHVYVNDVLTITQTDSAFAAGQPGIRLTAGATADGWSGGDK